MKKKIFVGASSGDGNRTALRVINWLESLT